MVWTLTKSGHFWTTYLPLLVNIVCEQPLMVSPAQKEYQLPSLKTLQPRKSPNNNSFHAKRRRKGNPLRWQLHDDQNSPTAAAAAMLGCSSSSYTRAAAATAAHLVRTPLCAAREVWSMRGGGLLRICYFHVCRAVGRFKNPEGWGVVVIWLA